MLSVAPFAGGADADDTLAEITVRVLHFIGALPLAICGEVLSLVVSKADEMPESPEEHQYRSVAALLFFETGVTILLGVVFPAGVGVRKHTT